MIRLSFVLLAFLAMTSSSTSADFTLPANKSSQIYDFAVWNPVTCAYPGKPSYKVGTQPQHGRLDFIYGFTRATNMPAHCKGKVKGLQVVYTPNRGYRGTDGFVLTVRQPRFLNDSGARGQTVRPRFTVK